MREASNDVARAEAAKMVAGGAYGAAGAAIETQLEKRPNDPDLHKEAAAYFGLDDRTRTRAIGHWNEALRLWLQTGRREEAIDEWLRAKRRHPVPAFDPGVLEAMGTALEATGLYNEAVEAYQAAARSPRAGTDGPSSSLRLARLLDTMGDRAAADKWYAYLLRTWPDSPESLEAAGRAANGG